MNSSKIFAVYTLIFALIVVGVISGLSNAATDGSFMASDGGTIPTRTPHSGGTIPTRTPSSGETIPTRTPNSGGTIPTRTPHSESGATIPTRTPAAESGQSADTAAASQATGYTTSSSNNGSMIVLQKIGRASCRERV